MLQVDLRDGKKVLEVLQVNKKKSIQVQILRSDLESMVIYVFIHVKCSERVESLGIM
jgi:hypothetical protein